VRYDGSAGVGGGVVVCSEGQVLGGGSGFGYVGSFEETGATEKSAIWERVEYVLLRESGQWKVDGRRVGASETTP